ncbi:hypothetical protein ACP4OV_006544 [Aristida adscensionis]
MLAEEEEGVGVAESGDSASPFFASLAYYIERSRKSQNFKTISARLAMWRSHGGDGGGDDDGHLIVHESGHDGDRGGGGRVRGRGGLRRRVRVGVCARQDRADRCSRCGARPSSSHSSTTSSRCSSPRASCRTGPTTYKRTRTS